MKLADHKTEDALIGSILSAKDPAHILGSVADILPSPMHAHFAKRESRIFAWALDGAMLGKITADGVAVLDWLRAQSGASARDMLTGKSAPSAGYPPTDPTDTAYDELRGCLTSEDTTGSLKTIRIWAQRLRELADARAALVILEELSDKITTSPHDLVVTVGASLTKLHRLATGGKREVDQGEALAEDASTRKKTSESSWGFGPMDSDDGVRFVRGEMTVLAAPSGGGKTSLAIQAAAKTADVLGSGSVAIASLEMSANTLASIMAGTKLGIPSAWIRENSPHLTAEDKADIAALAKQWSGEKSLYIRDHNVGTHARSLEAIIAWIRFRSMISNGALQLAIIDHIHLIQRPAKASAIDWIEQCSGMIKACASELNIPILVLAQMTKEGSRAIKDTKSGKVTATPEPVLQDLRGAAALGNDAAQVVFIHDEQAGTDRPDSTRRVRILVRKNRYGACRGFDATFHAKQQRFMPYSPEEKPRSAHHHAKPHESEDLFS